MSSFSLLRPADSQHQAAALSLLRFVAGMLFFIHGTQKLFGFPSDPAGAGAAHGTVHLMSLFGLAGCIETFGGALICLGLFTQVAAFVASGEMMVAYFKVHNPRSIFPILNRGEVVVLFCFVFFYVAFAGGGPYSLDAILRKRTPAGASED
jgi:putative oxidoreductase